MTKKTKPTNKSAAVGIALGLIAIVAVAGSIIFAECRLRAVEKKIYESVSQSPFESTYKPISISDDKKWLLLPEIDIKLPYSKDLAFQEYGRTPKYGLQSWCGDEEENKDRECWEVGFMPDGDDAIGFPPVAALLDTSKNYKLGDEYSSVRAEINGKEVTVPQIVSDIVTMDNGKKFYILTYDTDEHIDDDGTYMYQDLVDALKQAKSY